MLVIRFLGFQMKKNPFTVYVLNLAIADFSLLLFILLILTFYVVSAVNCFYRFVYERIRIILRRHPGKLYVAVLLSVIFMFIFGLPLIVVILLRGLYIPVLIYNIAYLLASLNSSINPVIYFLVGSCRQRRFQGSVKVALRRVFEEKVMSEERSHVPGDIVVDTTV
ncbi:proto-oncogene Mas-like [Alca torda]